MARAHVIGAGLAGLSAAIRLRQAGWSVTVHESAGQAGGRCRSYFDDRLGARIDNGNHLLLSGNRSAMAYLATIGAEDELTTVAPARIPFVELPGRERWTLRPNAGPIAWWIFAPGRRVPDTAAGDYLAALRLTARHKTVAQALDPARPAYRRFWEPMAVAALNTSADEGAARLLWPVITEIVARGEAAFRPCIARRGLSEAFVDPALAWLGRNGATVMLNDRARALSTESRRVARLDFGAEPVALDESDVAVLAVPPASAAALVPGLAVPEDARPIVNAHFKVDRPLPMPGGLPILGIVGGTAQWLFSRAEIASVTISAATAQVDQPNDQIAAAIWSDIRAALDLEREWGDVSVPPWRIVKEKRATIAQTPAMARLRPATRTAYRNLFLAGDWIDTGLPATIEGAVRSGEAAARAAGAPPA